MFAAGTRVEHATTTTAHKGTVECDDGKYVRVAWDDGKVGLLSYDRSVWFNAHNLIPLKK